MDQKKDFFQDVYQVVRLIPPGRVTSYGAIAKYLGAAKSSRTVGYAMNASHSQEIPVPAHRVVNRNGMLTGKYHFSSPDAMEKALINEGITIKNDTVVKFKELFWDPRTELKID